MATKYRTKYRLRDCDSGVTLDVDSETLADARSEADDWATNCGGYDASNGTIWVDTDIEERCEACEGSGEDSEGDRCNECRGDGWETVATYTTTISPDEPECSESEHDWQSPHSILGGLEENPGVRGHGGGVIIREVCMHCGCERKTDTWAQRRDNGRQGLTSVSYEAGKYADEVVALAADAEEES